MTAQLTHEGTQATRQPTAPDTGTRLRRSWRQVRLAVAEMNHAARRVVELQAPWAVDGQWHTR
jgi:hypothetical protein